MSRHHGLPLSATICFALLSACKLDPGADDGSGETSESDDGGTDETGDGDGDGDGDADNCEARDPAVSFDEQTWGIWSFEPSGVDQLDIDWTCTVNEVDASKGLYLLLDCPEAEAPVEIDIAVTPGFTVPLSGAETVQVRYVREPGNAGGAADHLRIDVDGQGHLLTLTNAIGLTPFSVPFELPFEIETIPKPSCATVPEYCGDAIRYALSFEFDGQPVEVLDGHHAALGGPTGTEVFVFESWSVPSEESSCTDAPDKWSHVLIVDTIHDG